MGWSTTRASLRQAVNRSLLLLFFGLVGACGDGEPTVPAHPDQTVLAIVDGTDELGNDDFFFLPPMVPDPSDHPSFDPGAFDPSLAPVVEICELRSSGDGCVDGPALATFTVASGSGSETVRLGDLDAEHYIVNWHTKAFDLNPELMYRITVLAEEVTLGYADVDIVTSGTELKRAAAGEYITLKNGRTLPIKFRIEQGALSTEYVFDGTGMEFGPRPLIAVAFTDATGTDIYPVGAEESYIFSLFDTGSGLVYIGADDATFLGIGAGSPTNPNQDTRVRVDGLSAIDPTTLLAPIGPYGAADGAQGEVLDVRVGPASPPQRPDLGLTLIGAPVANEVVALIDNTVTISRGPYAFCNGCDAEGPDITFYMPTDVGIPVPAIQLPLERFGSTDPALLDGATNGEKYLLNGAVFEHGGNTVQHDPTAVQPFRFWFDTGAPPTIINVRMATALGIDLSTDGSFDCWTVAGKEGNEGYVIDRISLLGSASGGAGTYTVENASVCVDVRDEELRQMYRDPNDPSVVVKLDAVIGANLFTHVPILFDGVNNTLGIIGQP
jgi:hypothetical protein